MPGWAPAQTSSTALWCSTPITSRSPGTTAPDSWSLWPRSTPWPSSRTTRVIRSATSPSGGGAPRAPSPRPSSGWRPGAWSTRSGTRTTPRSSTSIPRRRAWSWAPPTSSSITWTSCRPPMTSCVPAPQRRSTRSIRSLTPTVNFFENFLEGQPRCFRGCPSFFVQTGLQNIVKTIDYQGLKFCEAL